MVLDVGCGKEFPLAKLMYVNKMAPKYYLGVDVNKLETPKAIQNATNSKWFHFISQGDVTKLELIKNKIIYSTEMGDGKKKGVEGKYHMGREHPRPNVVVCFEMIEHVHPKLCRKTLKVIQQVLDPKGVAFVSTPCFNGSAAGNHINEMTYYALGSLLESLDFNINNHWGTFASISDYLAQLERDSGKNTTGYVGSDVLTAFDAFTKLREYYDTNVLATIFAPLYPSMSRNCLWELSPGLSVSKFPPLTEVDRPWSQHPDYLELAGER